MHKLICVLTIAGCLAVMATSAMAQDEEDRYKALEEKMKSVRVTMDFTDAPLRDVVAFMQQVSGINMLIDPELFKEKSEEELRVTLQVKNLRLKNAVDLVCSFFKLQTEFRVGGVLVITENTLNSGRMLVKVYDIRDMLWVIRDFPGPSITLKGAGQNTPGVLFSEDAEGKAPIDKDTLIELIKENMPQDWEHEKSGISMIRGLLVVTHNHKVQKKVKALLNMLRSTR